MVSSNGKSNGKSKKYLSLMLVMYAIKLKNDDDNKKCIKERVELERDPTISCDFRLI